MTESGLIERLEKLERDNRRFKKLSVAALVLAAVLGAIYATRPGPDVIKARQFVAVNNAGVPVGVMGTWGPGAVVLYLDAHGISHEHLPPLAIDDDIPAGPGVAVHGKASSITIGVPSGGPNIELSDGRGFGMDLGSAGTVTPPTGELQHTSAASIVMFGNDKKHHVIWQAP